MNKKLAIETLAFVLLIIAFPVISHGTDNDTRAVWILGIGLMILAGLLSVVTRSMDHSQDKVRDMGPELDERVS